MSKFKFGDKVLNSDGVLGVVTNEIDGLCFIAWTCHELDEGWYRESELTPATDWVKCSERMPKHGDMVLVFNGNSIEIDALATGEFDFECWCDSVTHWMPLPAPPVEVVK